MQPEQDTLTYTFTKGHTTCLKNNSLNANSVTFTNNVPYKTCAKLDKFLLTCILYFARCCVTLLTPLKGTEPLKDSESEIQALIYHKFDQDRMKNKRVTDISIIVN